MQSTVLANQAAGVVGEFSFESPSRAKPYILRTTDRPEYNVVGRAFTVVSEGVATAGGTGFFAGILANPKVYASYGTAVGGPLAPTLTLANEVVAELVQMGQLWVTIPGAAAIGDPVVYDTTTGALDTVPANASFTGVIAVTTGILTVSSPVGDFYLSPGPISGTGVPAGTVITAQLSGTAGQAGTYQTNITTAVASTAMKGVNGALAAGAGKAFVPNAYVTTFTPTGAGLASITLTDA